MQVPPGAMVPPLKLIEPLPGDGAKVGAPQPDVVGFGAGATTMAPGATGKVSPKATPDTARLALGLVIVKVRVETVPASTGFGANCLSMPGGRMPVIEAVPMPDGPVLVPPSVEETKPLTLSCGPAVVTVTVAVMLHEAPAARVPPVKARVLGAVRVSVPPHWGELPEVTVTPAGRTSLNAMPESASPAFGFVIVKVSVEVPPTATGLGEKLLL